MKSRYLLFTILVALFLVGCDSDQNKSSEQQQGAKQITLPDFSSISTSDVFVYNCGDSLQFTAHVTRDSTWLFVPDTALKVLPVSSGSGARYEGSSYLYWSKGKEAILQKPKGSFMTCTEIKREKSWQAARLRGMDFRAIGQEPGWLLEINNNKKLTFIADYGQDTLMVQQYQQQKNSDSDKVYTAKIEDRSLKIRVTNKSCTDAMSGFKFPKTVTVSLNEKTYSGCGQSLIDIKQIDSR